jgi:hypothetical protein
VSRGNSHGMPQISNVLQVACGHLCLNPTSIMLLVLGDFKTLGKGPYLYIQLLFSTESIWKCWLYTSVLNAEFSRLNKLWAVFYAI